MQIFFDFKPDSSDKDKILEDFYKILGVADSAGKEEIKKVYRKLALKFHPDRNKGDKAAEKKFKTITEAYFVLSDEKRRSEYDSVRKYGAAGDGGFGNFRGAYSGDFNSIFEEILRQSGGQRGFRSQGSQNSSDFFSDLFGSFGSRAKRGETRPSYTRANETSHIGGDIEASLTLGFWEALKGCKKDIQFKIERNCAVCNGSGTRKNSFRRESGCEICHGSGKEKHFEKLTITIPAGVETGSFVRLKGKGQLGRNGQASGNLLIKITVIEDPFFRRNGQDLYMEIPISLEEALLGSAIHIPTGGGEVMLKIPPSTTGKKKLRLTGKGVANNKTGENGDLIVDLKIILPDKMTEEARGHLLRFSQLQSYNPRPNWKH